jgi:hypothetical protein
MRIVIVACIAATVAACSSFSPCENRVTHEAKSSGTKRAVVFSRECGATTGFSSHLSILDAQQALPDEAGNAAVLGGRDTIRGVRWADATTLVVEVVKGAEVFERKAQVAGVKVDYRVVEPVPFARPAP